MRNSFQTTICEFPHVYNSILIADDLFTHSLYILHFHRPTEDEPHLTDRYPSVQTWS